MVICTVCVLFHLLCSVIDNIRVLFARIPTMCAKSYTLLKHTSAYNTRVYIYIVMLYSVIPLVLSHFLFSLSLSNSRTPTHTLSFLYNVFVADEVIETTANVTWPLNKLVYDTYNQLVVTTSKLYDGQEMNVTLIQLLPDGSKVPISSPWTMV